MVPPSPSTSTSPPPTVYASASVSAAAAAVAEEVSAEVAPTVLTVLVALVALTPLTVAAVLNTLSLRVEMLISDDSIAALRVEPAAVTEVTAVAAAVIEEEDIDLRNKSRILDILLLLLLTGIPLLLSLSAD